MSRVKRYRDKYGINRCYNIDAPIKRTPKTVAPTITARSVVKAKESNRK